MMNVRVTKYDQTRQPFDRQKVINTARRMGLSPDAAGAIADTIEDRLYEGIPTREILRIVHQQARKYRPEVAGRVNLRRALSLIRPQPDFEIYIQMLLRAEGYSVSPNQVFAGKCGEHEVDGIAVKDGTTWFIEVKHHRDYHRLIGLDEGRIARAILEDLEEGFQAGITPLPVNKAMIVCNTKLSVHARQYATCRGIEHIGWGYPADHDLEALIEEHQFYPVTLLRNLDTSMIRRLGNARILTLRQLVQEEPEAAAHKTGIGESRARALIEQAESLLSPPH